MGKHGGDQGGRPKAAKTMVNEALDRIDQKLPAIFEALIDRAVKGDREAQIYLIDRRLGKPKQQTDIDLKANLDVTLPELKFLIEGMARRKIELENPERPLLEEGDDAIQE